MQHLAKSNSCKMQYGKQFNELKTSKDNEKNEQRASYRSQNKEFISQRNSQFYSNNQDKIKEKQQLKYTIAFTLSTLLPCDNEQRHTLV